MPSDAAAGNTEKKANVATTSRSYSAHLPAEEPSTDQPNDAAANNTDDDDNGQMDQMPPTLQTFLSHFGVLSSSTGAPSAQQQKQNATTSLPSHSWRDLIFESAFDLTEDRLRYVFDMLDTDKAGRLSYDSLRRGIEMHSTSTTSSATQATSYGGRDSKAEGKYGSHPAEQHNPLYLTQDSFDRLVEFLDVDKSQDITFEEFSTGLRYLMLRALFPSDASSIKVQASIEMLDYDAQHLERRVVVDEDVEMDTKDDRQSKSKSKTDEEAMAARSYQPSVSQTDGMVTQRISTTDFYFHDRPKWVQTRWINVSGAKSSITLKRLAVRYMLHPLALEDALSPENHRPKAEVYSNHYFIMIPIFCIDPPTDPNDDLDISGDLRSRPRNMLSFLRNCWRRCCGQEKISSSGGDNDDDENDCDEDDAATPPRIGKIRVHMTSLFVNVPKNDTMITFNSELFEPSGYVASLEKLSTPTCSGGARTSSSPLVETAAIARPSTEDSHPNEQHCWTRIYHELSKSYSKLRQYDAQYLTYALLDQAVDLLEPILHAMRHEISRQEKILHSISFKSSIALKRVHHLRIELEKVARKLKPFIRLLVHVIEDDAISHGATVYLRDVLDNLECHEEEVYQLIEDCQAIDALADKYQSQQMDRSLYTLTVISAVFLPAQFLTGLWGMNFESMPELDADYGYKMFWGVASSVVLIMVIVLKGGRI